MFWKISLVLIVILRSRVQCGSDFKQERAKVLYVNPKYISNVTIFTYRENRNSPYLTTCNFTNLFPVENNVSVRLDFTYTKIQAYPIKLEFKFCDGLKQNWLKDWIKMYSDIPHKQCPLPAGVYHIVKFELPPKNFPIQFSNGEMISVLTLFHTTTKERIAQTSITLKFNAKKSK